MFLRCILLGISFFVILFILDILLPKLKLKYILHKELKIKKLREKAFGNKMKKLEINWISNSFVIPKKCRQKINWRWFN